MSILSEQQQESSQPPLAKTGQIREILRQFLTEDPGGSMSAGEIALYYRARCRDTGQSPTTNNILGVVLSQLFQHQGIGKKRRYRCRLKDPTQKNQQPCESFRKIQVLSEKLPRSSCKEVSTTESCCQPAPKTAEARLVFGDKITLFLPINAVDKGLFERLGVWQ